MKHHIKILVLVAIITSNLQLPTSNCLAQNVTIPDTAFVSWLNGNGFSSCMSGNRLDTTCNEVLNATSIDCHARSIANLSGIQYFKNLTTLNCYNNYLTTLPSLPIHLTYLNCEGNLLTALPALPTSLTYLDCGGNELTTLPPLTNSLYHLDCRYNQLSRLPPLLSSLTYIDCSFNIIDSLPAIPSLVSYLNCSNNQLRDIPFLPSSLTLFYCSSNLLAHVPVFPQSLHWLAFAGNDLTGAVPTMPNNLYTLDCSNNEFTSLPATLPATLQTMWCHTNQFSSLPALPATLQLLACNTNRLTSLPQLPSNLTYLDCSQNQLTSIPGPLPDSLNTFNIDQNPNLACIPPINKVFSFNFYSTAIQCLPDYGQVTVSDPDVYSVPLCSNTFNPNNCEVINGVEEFQVSGFKFQVFPNPAGSSFTISSSVELNNAVVEIDDVIGQRIYFESIKTQDTRLLPDGRSGKTIDSSNMPAGIYFISLTTSGMTQTIKLVKN